MQATTETPETRQDGFHNHLLIRLIQVNGGDGGASMRADGAREGGLYKKHQHRLKEVQEIRMNSLIFL